MDAVAQQIGPAFGARDRGQRRIEVLQQQRSVGVGEARPDRGPTSAQRPVATRGVDAHQKRRSPARRRGGQHRPQVRLGPFGRPAQQHVVATQFDDHRVGRVAPDRHRQPDAPAIGRIAGQAAVDHLGRDPPRIQPGLQLRHQPLTRGQPIARRQAVAEGEDARPLGLRGQRAEHHGQRDPGKAAADLNTHGPVLRFVSYHHDVGARAPGLNRVPMQRAADMAGVTPL